jgi:23S rRNA (uracil1939-C5)-methyltransferase
MRANFAKHNSKTPGGEFQVRIDKLVYGGEGLGRQDGRVIFVPFSAPGDTLVVQTLESRKGFARAEIREILQPGSSRRMPACRHFGVCGGCHWQHVEYCTQLEAKRNILEETFRHRFPETRNLEIGIKPSPAEYGYRSRARIQVRHSATGLRLGFYRMRSHAVEQIEACPLLRPSLNGALAALRDRFEKSPPSVGVRDLEIISSEDAQKWTCASPGNEGECSIAPGFPGAEEDCLLVRKVQGIAYSVSPLSFFQANDFMVSDLVSCVMSLVQAAGPRSALDLYGGVGLFSLPIAQQAKEVVSVESAPIASGLCRANAAAAGLDNVRVVQAEAGDWLNSAGAPPAPGVDLILLNPPRTGAGRAIMDLLPRIGAETIIYVSCDPQTLARDLGILRERGYRIDFVEGLDLFPQTYHFETVVRLLRG